MSLIPNTSVPSAATAWFIVTQKQIDEFAECTQEHQFIHVDPQKAKRTLFGSTIAHGFLSLSTLAIDHYKQILISAISSGAENFD